MDYRDLEIWKDARLLVCVFLELTEPISQTAHYGTFAENINRLSFSILDDIARGYENNPNHAWKENVQRSIDLLEHQLEHAHRKGLLNVPDTDQVVHVLDAIKKT